MLYYIIFLANLCDYITDGNGGASEQVSIIGSYAPYFYPRLQKQNVAELQGFSQVAKKIGSKYIATVSRWLQFRSKGTYLQECVTNNNNNIV